MGTLDDLNAQINALRAEAGRLRGAYATERKMTEASSKLTVEGKRDYLTDQARIVSDNIRRLAEAEAKAIRDTQESLRRGIFPATGSSPEALIAHRDAQDRADQIATPEEATRIMRRALDDNDTSLAKAVLRRATSEGPLGKLLPAVDVYLAAFPADSARLHDLQKVEQLGSDLNFTMSQAWTYAPVS
jgi:hypothetical protein